MSTKLDCSKLAGRAWVAFVFAPAALQTSCSLGDYDHLQRGSSLSTGGTRNLDTASPGGSTTSSANSGGVSAASGGYTGLDGSGLGGATGTAPRIGGGGATSLATAGGSTATGGASTTGGTSSITTSAPTACEGDPNVTGSATRPQLTTAAAAGYTPLAYLS